MCAHKIGDVKPIVQSSRVCTRHVHDACMNVRNAYSKFGLRMHANCISQGQSNKLYKHVYVLRCNPTHDTRCKSCYMMSHHSYVLNKNQVFILNNLSTISHKSCSRCNLTASIFKKFPGGHAPDPLDLACYAC